MPDENGVATVLGRLAGLASSVAPKTTATAASGVQDVRAALEEFGECVRYINTRRGSGAILPLDSEASVQDAIYLMMRSWVPDLIPETPTDKVGNRYTVRDFFSRKLRLVIEAKFVRDKNHGRNIAKELHDDIEVYRHNPNCDTILFFIYDPDSHIPDSRELKRTIEQSRVYDGRPLTCFLVVKP